VIVNADDFGLSQAINRGVIAAHRNGIVTSASLMVNGPAFEHAVALAKENPALDIGVHLSLTELSPVAAPETVASLVDERMAFAPHARDFAARYLRGRIVLAEVATELDAQLRRARSQGLAISHIDSHQHVHALPGIARVVLELASAHGIPAIRVPSETLRCYVLSRVRNAPRVAEQLALNAVCAFSPLRRCRDGERFVGFHFGGQLTQRNLETALRALPASGTFELMCHPADEEADGPHSKWGYAGPAEREALTSEATRQLIRERGIALVSRRDR
jgi:hopanoid biosynthesis associated protein HpnK